MRVAPTFCQFFILADEINRAPAKYRVPLPKPCRKGRLPDASYKLQETAFGVLATQNLIEQEGTYTT
jgi:MoxR-like ATPase